MAALQEKPNHYLHYIGSKGFFQEIDKNNVKATLSKSKHLVASKFLLYGSSCNSTTLRKRSMSMK